MTEDGFFTILDSVDSTNNYAMGRVHAGLAKHGMGWFTKEQTAGKGQRGRVWATEKGKNIAMSLVLEPNRLPFTNQFHVSAAIAITVFEFFSKYAGDETKIKWPNDLFWCDRKAGGILIENIFQGKQWKWAIVGIGININQIDFDPFDIPPVSLKMITGKAYQPVELAKELFVLLMKNLTALTSANLVIEQYNAQLYKKDKLVTLNKDGTKFNSIIKEVTSDGRLLTVDAIEREFNFGEVLWVL